VTTEEAMEVRANLVTLALTESVALSASGLEKVGTLLRVTCFQLVRYFSSLQLSSVKEKMAVTVRDAKEVRISLSNEHQHQHHSLGQLC
jgi:hypothetical protein